MFNIGRKPMDTIQGHFSVLCYAGLEMTFSHSTFKGAVPLNYNTKQISVNKLASEEVLRVL